MTPCDKIVHLLMDSRPIELQFTDDYTDEQRFLLIERISCIYNKIGGGSYQADGEVCGMHVVMIYPKDDPEANLCC